MLSLFILLFILATVFSIVFTLLVRYLALKAKIVDFPETAPERKIHQKPVPLLGGLAIFLSFFIILFLFYFSPFWPGIKIGLLTVLSAPKNLVLFKHILGLFVASLLIMTGGFLDDKYKLKAHQQIVWPILAVLIIIASGIGIRFVNNPFGGLLYLDKIRFELFRFRGVPFYFVPLADLFTFVWLMLCAYTTKLLDGLDGLVSGLTVIGAIVIAGLCLLTAFYQPDVAALAIILAGANFGFLIFNFHPAKIFLGEGGSLWTGFMLGNLAIISGGKIATALMILGVPLIDLFSVIIQRLFLEHRSPFKFGDKKHLHFRLLNLGLPHQLVVVIFWLIAFGFGLGAIIFQRTTSKVMVLSTLFFLAALIITLLVKREKQFRNL